MSCYCLSCYCVLLLYALLCLVCPVVVVLLLCSTIVYSVVCLVCPVTVCPVIVSEKKKEVRLQPSKRYSNFV